jgi:hypothetical protein
MKNNKNDTEYLIKLLKGNKKMKNLLLMLLIPISICSCNSGSSSTVNNYYTSTESSNIPPSHNESLVWYPIPKQPTSYNQINCNGVSVWNYDVMYAISYTTDYDYGNIFQYNNIAYVSTRWVRYLRPDQNFDYTLSTKQPYLYIANCY